MKYILILAIFIMGCETLKQQGIENEKNLINQDLSYYKDSKTGLCFAAISIGSTAQSVTNVPCTPEVERLIK